MEQKRTQNGKGRNKICWYFWSCIGELLKNGNLIICLENLAFLGVSFGLANSVFIILIEAFSAMCDTNIKLIQQQKELL